MTEISTFKFEYELVAKNFDQDSQELIRKITELQNRINETKLKIDVRENNISELRNKQNKQSVDNLVKFQNDGIFDLITEKLGDAIRLAFNLGFTGLFKIIEEFFKARISELERRVETGEARRPRGSGTRKLSEEEIENAKESLLRFQELLDATREDLKTLQEQRDFILDPVGVQIENEAEELKRFREILKNQEDELNLLIQQLGNDSIGLNISPEQIEDTTNKVDQQRRGFNALGFEVATIGDVYGLITERQSNYNEEAKQTEQTIGKLDKRTEDVVDTTKSLDKQVLRNVKGIKLYDENLQKTDATAQQLGEDGLPKIADGAEEANQALSNIDIKNILNNLSTDEIAQLFNVSPEEAEKIKQSLKNAFAGGGQAAKQELDSLGVFAADIAANINDSFADLIFNGFKGNFEGLGELWEGTLDTMLEALSQFAATAISNPIRIGLESVFNGLIPSGPIGVPDGEEPGITNLLGGGLGGGIATILSDLGAFASETIPLIGTAINAAIAVALTAVSLIKGLTKKKPQLDVDLDQIRDEFGRSTGQAAKVLDFLDDEVANSIINISTKRKAGLGGIGDSGIQKQIREAIQTQIQDLQDIINTLPFELASALNESLLNTEVDIESEVKGDRLLEFDETKNISEKFDQFINGDLQARFLFSIREFFVGAFESLGVLGSAAQDFIDAEFEKFQGLSREERIEAGEDLLQDFQTLTDAFNVINNNGADSIGATVNSIKNLSNSLGFDAVPSIDELDAGLEDLINAAELDPDVIQDYLDLRNAILEAQRAILSSIQSIISSISSLNSIIVDGGGSAFDLTGFINDGLDSVTGLLGQDGLSVEDREELLGLGTGFLDQLIAEEQAAFQAQLEATQQAAEAAAEAQRSAIRAQISGLEDERDLIEENFDARLEALQEELRLAEEFARLTESIQQTLNSIILGPDSVFTAVERLNIVQGDIASLQSELAATTDPSRQLELAGQLEDSLSTLFDLAGEAFGVNSPEFVAIFDQVTGGLNDLLDLTGNRERSVEEINAEIEALNIERNEQLEAIDAQIESLNEQLSSIQAENVEATFQASDRVQELAEFFRNEYITLLEERFEQLGEVSETGFTEEIEALNSLDLNISQLKDSALQSVEIEDSMLIELRDMNQTFKQAFGDLEGFRDGTGGFVDFGRGTLAVLHGREAVIPESQFTPFNRLQEATGEMNVNINVNVDGGSSGTVETLATNIEDMLVRSIRQGGKLRSAVQEAGARRLN